MAWSVHAPLWSRFARSSAATKRCSPTAASAVASAYAKRAVSSSPKSSPRVSDASSEETRNADGVSGGSSSWLHASQAARNASSSGVSSSARNTGAGSHAAGSTASGARPPRRRRRARAPPAAAAPPPPRAAAGKPPPGARRRRRRLSERRGRAPPGRAARRRGESPPRHRRPARPRSCASVTAPRTNASRSATAPSPPRHGRAAVHQVGQRGDSQRQRRRVAARGGCSAARLGGVGDDGHEVVKQVACRRGRGRPPLGRGHQREQRVEARHRRARGTARRPRRRLRPRELLTTNPSSMNPLRRLGAPSPPRAASPPTPRRCVHPAPGQPQMDSLPSVVAWRSGGAGVQHAPPRARAENLRHDAGELVERLLPCRSE